MLFAHGSGSSRHSPRNQFVARVIREAGNGTLLFDLLTREEEIEDDVTGRLRFDIGCWPTRLAAATRWLRANRRRDDLSSATSASSTGGARGAGRGGGVGKAVDAVVSRGGRPDLAGDALPRVQSPTLLIVGGYDDEVIRLNEAHSRELPLRKGDEDRAGRDTSLRGSRRAGRSGAFGSGLVSPALPHPFGRRPTERRFQYPRTGAEL